MPCHPSSPHGCGAPEGHMQFRFEGQQVSITPHLLGWIAERLEHLNTPHGDIAKARAVLIKHLHWRRCRHEARLELVLPDKTLIVRQTVNTPSEAVRAALQVVERKLDEYRLGKRIVSRAL